MLGNTHTDGQLANGLYGCLCCLLIAHACRVNIHCLGNLHVLVYGGRHVELHHRGQKQGICHTVGYVEDGAQRVCHAVYHAKTHVGEGHAGNVLCHGHAIACLCVLWFVHGSLQIACYHLYGLQFEHVAHFPCTLGDETLNGMCKGIHTGGCGQAAG